MKRVLKGPAPNSLQNYILKFPDANWEQMRSDNANGGSQASHECRNQAISDQKGLCAYCEQSISSNDPLHRRLEHFHPKSDRAGIHNWDLDWENMLAVCDGGSNRSKDEIKSYPLPSNLSCDAHKDHMIQTKKLPILCEGRLLNPLSVPAFPNLFALDKGTGRLMPAESSCATTNVAANVFGTTGELTDNTIDILNINCNRLVDKRRRLVINVEYNKKRLRESGYPPAEAYVKLVDRYFKTHWPEFFTTIRCCLGAAAEVYLKTIEFQG